MIGDARNFLTALIVVNPEPLMDEIKELEIPANSVEEALDQSAGPRAVRGAGSPSGWPVFRTTSKYRNSRCWPGRSRSTATN